MLVEKPRILIVDDQKNDLKLLANLLRGDAQISLAKNGKQALDKVFKLQPDLVLLDVVMPEMDGFEVLKKLNERPATSQIPVVFISGQTDMVFEEKAFALGATDYLLKPLREVSTKARVKLYLQIARQRKLLQTTALIDPLTRLPNRKKFQEIFHIEWRATMRNQTWLSVALLEIQYRDINNWLIAEELMEKAASIISQKFNRSRDFVARYSDSEFVLLLPGCEPGGAEEICQKCRQAVTALQFEPALKAARGLSVVLGGVSLIPGKTQEPESLTALMSQNVHQAKQSLPGLSHWSVK